jgi:hypothetical protein
VHQLIIKQQSKFAYQDDYLFTIFNLFFRRQISVTNVHIDEDRSRIKNDLMNRGEWIEKCPMCIMIFADGMSQHDRQLHVEEHLNK